MLLDYKMKPSNFRGASFCRPLPANSLFCDAVVGATPRGELIYSASSTLPAVDPLWIRSSRGCRLVTDEEWRRMKGIPTDWPVSAGVDSSLIACPSVHLWSVLGDLIGPFITLRRLALSDFSPPLVPDAQVPPLSVENVLWSWSVPDLCLGGPWYTARVATLTAVAAAYPDPAAIISEGLQLLEDHRTNYTADGPQKLVVLWWEWPPEHHAALRLGVSMNFLDTPVPGLFANAKMPPEELATAISFVDELITLGVLEPVPAGEVLSNNCPLFIVPKPGQPGQYRCIADMKRGNQNAVCGPDPCQMTSPGDILPLLNHGGFSASLDISKFFHMFLTVLEERNYLGLIHPATGVHYRYSRLPMGSSNSPAASGRFGASFIRTILESFPEFHGSVCDNDFTTILNGRAFNPCAGIGRIKMGIDGLPACNVWLHVDDLLLHGPTHHKVGSAMSNILDLTVRLGFICNPTKLTPPSQSVKYCGFLYDTSTFPRLQIPKDKVSRSIALIDYVIRANHRRLSRYALSCVVGTLQSLVPATPNAIGSSFLTPSYNCVHAILLSSFGGNHDLFYSSIVSLTADAEAGLLWWRKSLTNGLQEQLQLNTVGSLGVSWGDGSGTGTGGTIEWVDAASGPLPNFEIWMGTWSPIVHSFSSNWRELRTLVATMDSIAPASLRNRVILYFTDNIVTYHNCRRGTSGVHNLRLLIQRLKLMDLAYHCRLEVIHVPGTSMIRQGTDGLSRGLWLPVQRPTSFNFSSALFRAAPLSAKLVPWALHILADYHPSYPSLLLDDFHLWTGSSLLHRHCLWSLSPTFARQGFLAAVLAWIEDPWHSSHIFIVPRVLQRDFGRVNKNIVFLGQHSDVPLPIDFDPLVPFVLFYLPPFVRKLPNTEPDRTLLDEAPFLHRPG
jgi:hypothetical protein